MVLRPFNGRHSVRWHPKKKKHDSNSDDLSQLKKKKSVWGETNDPVSDWRGPVSEPDFET